MADKIELPPPPAVPALVGQVQFVILSDGSCNVAITGQVSATNLATVLGVANAQLGGLLFKAMNNGIVTVNGMY